MTDIKPDTHNANKGTKRGKDLLRKSLQELGGGRSILLDKDGNIIAGNKTFEGAQDVGLKVRVVKAGRDEIVAVQREDLDLMDPSGEARRLAYMDNRVAELDLDWDADQLAEDLALGIDLDSLGFGANELYLIIGDMGDKDVDAEPKLDKADELCIQWGTVPGQLWKLGNHYLLCGDCTNEQHVSALLNGLQFDLLCTDPPYGVNIKGGDGGEMTIANDNAKDLPALLNGSFSLAKQQAAKKAAFYIAGPHGAQFYEFARAIISVGMIWKQTLVWAKNNLVFGRSDYQPKHEVIFYGNFGNGRMWNGGRKQTTVIEETMQRLSFLNEKEIQVNFGDQVYIVRGDNLEAFEAESDLLQVEKPQKNELHPTIKPTKLIKRLVRNSSNEGDVVYDPFSGAGTTILACENTKRICYAMELLPKFVAVDLQRWQDATGQAPMLLKNILTSESKSV
jgi:DNA modification methylase